ncbi:efflux RND transporter permease subunit [Piscinibacter koreensis]|uniref:Efflux RND transporter permease subunit n=1 Tax=Piscinibacter koreensis TaxID=2742824 RepID=A0A7Y6NJS9_9BURK|nr:efflux RND transporter permease subunit [Schlegelella koreensis]NUZ04495.1 efflux RND transporter permease subunit [Schlegelella koreensis]
MSPSAPFIARPVATALLMLAIVLSGLVGYRLLPLSALPQVDYPTIQVQTLYPGASPEVMSRTVTAPLERQFGQMAGLARMNSTSAAGASIITLQFSLGQTLDVAEQEVQAAINAGASLLPADLPAPPVYAKVNPADAPVLTLAITSDTMPLTEVQNLVNTRLAQKISQVGGVGLVSLAGGQRPAMRIQADTQALASYGLGLDTLRTAIASANANSAKGSFDGPRRAYTINSNDQLLTVDAYKNLVVAYRNEAPVRLKDVAQVVEGAENTRLGAWAGINGVLKPAIILNVQRQPGANVIATVDAIKAQLPELQRGLPAALQVDVLADRTTGIRASVEHVQIELVLAVVLVVLVIFAFLGSLRATVIASLAVPISLIGSCGVMYLLGYSLNNLSLMALTIATGFVVDDAIVMIENISRHLEMARDVSSEADFGAAEVVGADAQSPRHDVSGGATMARNGQTSAAAVAPSGPAGAAPAASPARSTFDIAYRAALAGASEIGFTIISLTVSLIAVLIPLLFMGDVVGRLFREFAVTLAITILISAVVSLTLVPMMSARWLQVHEKTARPGSLGARLQRLFDGVMTRYDRSLTWVIDHRGLTLLVALATLVLTVLLYLVIPKGLFPTQDTGQLQARVQAAEDVSYERMADLQQAAARAILRDPDVASVASFIGVDATNNTMLHTGRMLINLKAERAAPHVVMDRLRERVRGVAGVTLYLQPTQDLTIDAESGPTEYRFALEGADTATVTEWTRKLAAELQRSSRVRNVVSDAGAEGLAAFIDIDRDTAARLGVTASAVDDALYSAFGQRIVSTIFTETNQYRVILEARPGLLTNAESLGKLNLKTASGETTPLAAFARISERPAPLQITHVAQFPATTVGFDTAPGVALGDAVDAIRAAAKAIALPASVQLTFLGASGAYENSLSNQLWLILAAVICVYIVLGVLYESYVHPLTILSTLPSAGVGALLALWLSGNGLGVIGIIGIILLIGIVKKNAIMMIDFAIEAERGGLPPGTVGARGEGQGTDPRQDPELRTGLSPREAIHQAALLRFRPILMTTLAALFAALPLMLGWGEGAELRRPLGLAIFGGLIVSQLLTLFTTPVIYLAFDDLGRRIRKRPARLANVQGGAA